MVEQAGADGRAEAGHDVGAVVAAVGRSVAWRTLGAITAVASAFGTATTSGIAGDVQLRNVAFLALAVTMLALMTGAALRARRPVESSGIEAAAHAVGREPAEAVMIGDGIATDLAAARAVGARCVLMLTGVTSQTQVDALPVAERPTEVAADAAELAATLDRLAADVGVRGLPARTFAG